MILHTALLALLLQASPAAALIQSPKASVAGVVVNANGEPVSNIRVSLGRLNVNLGAFTQMVGGERPPREMTLPAEVISAIAEEVANEVANGGIRPEEAAQAAAFQSVSLADIHEVIVSPTGGTVVVPKSSPPVMSDDRGRFVFNDVEPGTYRLMFSGSGYAKQDYGQRTIGAGGVPLVLASGQAKTDIVMRMMTVGALGGRIHDASGQPAAGVPVQLFRFSYDETGQKKVQRVAAARTDDLGDYRMYYLTPGRYYISAGNQPGQQQIGATPGLQGLLLGGGYSTQNRIPQNYAMTYYPGVANENAATVIDVQPGADLRGIDLLVTPQQTYRVRGRVIDPRTGQPPQTVSISLVPRADLEPFSGISINSGNPNYKATDGSFELQNVSAGAYTINASLPNPPQTRQPDLNAMSPAERTEYFRTMEAAEFARPKASVPVNVVNADVEGVQLSLGVSSSIPGRLRVEPNAPIAGLDFIRVQLKGITVAWVDPITRGAQPRPVTPDGIFRIDDVWPGEYRVSIAGLPPGFYLKEARFGPADVLNQPLLVAGADSTTLDVVISPNVGALEGAVLDSTGQPAPGAQVVLIPSRNRHRTELFRPVTSDSSGRFTIPAVAPGEYLLAAWEAIEPNAFFDPNLILQAEANGKPVRVAESSNQTLSITQIPTSAR
jgi:5-hydroxyisourate hydrolase-like protein (transthyretin family)